MRRRVEIEIVGDHVRDEDEKLERRDLDRPALGPDLSSAKILSRALQTAVPNPPELPSPLASTKKDVTELYRKYKPNYADHVLSLTTKI
jgi:hypothetical protein